MSDDQPKATEINLTETDAAAPTSATPAEAAASPAEAAASPAEPAAAASPEPPPPPTPEERIAALEAEKAELRERMLRIAADFDNWKKRARKEQADGELRARETVLRDFLEIADNLDRAAAAFGSGKDGEAQSIRDGVDLVLRQFRSKLERYQVKALEAVGQPFDPRFHEAISQTPTSEVKPGSVLHELQKGYLIGDRLLRPALVVVATAPPEAPAHAAEEQAPTAPVKSEGED
jgi:molecular chaperone GrpE